MGWPDAMIEGARALEKGQKCVGRAVTMRFVPARPDIAADKPPGMESPEYEAFEKCDSKSVLVMSSVGPWESVGGDIKFLRLKQLGLAGLVTDGSVRDTDEILSYGFACFSYSTTAKQGPAAMQPWECNGVMSCGGVVVRPGDAIVGDQDGVVVVPASHAQQVYDIAHGREEIEGIIKEELIKSTCHRAHKRHHSPATTRHHPPLPDNTLHYPPPPDTTRHHPLLKAPLKTVTGSTASSSARPRWPRMPLCSSWASCVRACTWCDWRVALLRLWQTRARLASTTPSSLLSSQSRPSASCSLRRASNSTRRARAPAATCPLAAATCLRPRRR